MLRFVVVLLVGCAIFGCTNRGMYESIQMSQKRECDPLPPAEYERCIEQYEKDYDEYQRDREALEKRN